MKKLLFLIPFILLGCAKETEFAPIETGTLNDCDPVLSLKVGAWLQAPYNTATDRMVNTLTQLGLTPNLTNQQQAAGNHNAIVDWVTLTLIGQNGVEYGPVPAIIQADGDIRQPSGGNVHIQAPYGYYRVKVNHRNHLPAITVQKYIGNDTQTFDLRSGNHLGNCGQVQVESGVWALWGGDANGDEKVIYSGPNNDPATVYSRTMGSAFNTSQLPNYILGGYWNEDLRMDGSVVYSGNANDPSLVFSNVLACPCNTYGLPNYILQ